MTDTKTNQLSAKIISATVVFGLLAWTGWTLYPAIKGDLEYQQAQSEIEKRAQRTAPAPAPKHHPRPAAETAPARSSKIVASLAEFQAGLPLLAQGKFETSKHDWGTLHSWKGPSGNGVGFYDHGGDGALDRLMVLVNCSPDDEQRQLAGFATVFRLVELASGQKLDGGKFMESVVNPATKGEITKWFGDTQVSARVHHLKDGAALSVFIGNWDSNARASQDRPKAAKSRTSQAPTSAELLRGEVASYLHAAALVPGHASDLLAKQLTTSTEKGVTKFVWKGETDASWVAFFDQKSDGDLDLVGAFLEIERPQQQMSVALALATAFRLVHHGSGYEADSATFTQWGYRCIQESKAGKKPQTRRFGDAEVRLMLVELEGRTGLQVLIR